MSSKAQKAQERKDFISSIINQNACEIWANEDGKILPNPKDSKNNLIPSLSQKNNNNATSEGSYNVLISDECWNRFQIKRKKNLYDVEKSTSQLTNKDEQMNTSPVAKSNVDATSSSKILELIQKKERENDTILNDTKLSALDKIKKIVGVDINDKTTNGSYGFAKKVWNPPYYSKNDVKEILKRTNENNDDAYFYSLVDKNFKSKYTQVYNQHFLKILLYAIIYKISFNYNFLKTHFIKTFRKTVITAFKEYLPDNYENIDNIFILENKLQSDPILSFLFYFGFKENTGSYNDIKQNKNRDKIFEASSEDIENHFLRFYLSLHQEPIFIYLRKKLIYYKRNSLERDSSYTSLSNSDNSNIDINEIELCRYHYSELEKKENLKQFAKDMIKSCNKFKSKQINIQDEKNMLHDIKNMILSNVINEIHSNKGRRSIDIDDYRIYQYTINNDIYYYRNLNFDNRFDYLLEVDHKHPLKSLFQKYLELQSNSINFLTLPIENISVKKLSQDGVEFVAIDAGGVRKDFFNDITQELFQKKIFIESNVKILKTKRYFLNTSFDLKDLDKEFIKSNEDSCEKLVKSSSSHSSSRSSSRSPSEIRKEKYENMIKINKFYTFLGELIIFLWLNNFKLPHMLSSFLLSRFITKHYLIQKYDDEDKPLLKNTDYIYFLTRDFHNAYKFLINQPLLHEYNISDTIELDTFTSLSKIYKNKVNNENYLEYLTKLSKYIYIQSEDFQKEKHNKLFFNAFNKKIQNISSILNEFKISLKMIENDLTKSKITNEFVKKFVQNIKLDYRGDIRHVDFGNRIKANFYEYIVNKDNFEDYFSNLLKFWSGNDEYYENQTYYILIDSDFDSQLLPSSHTCFNTIDIPCYTCEETEQLNDYKIFFDKLEVSIKNIHNADMLGGRNNKKRKVIRNKMH